MKQSLFKDETQQYVEQIKSGANAILVAVRVRPLSQKQLLISDFQTVQVLDNQLLALMDPGNQFQMNDTLRKNRNKQTQFAFDFVFDKMTKTKQIYDDLVKILIDGIMDGYNATVLAYGPTGCGKTFTMVGSNQNPGIMPLCMIDLLSRTKQQKKFKDFLIKVSYIQIYNQNIKDLLISQDKNFQLREDPKEGAVISGVTQVAISNITQLNTVLKVGNRNRTKQFTGANDASSRSHAILQVLVQSKNKAQSTVEETIVGKMSLVDLAGSQRASNTTNKGQRMVQGAKINQSLLVLGNCIQALSQAVQKKQKNIYIPYRGSKLTRLLKDSLGGNCRTVMISNVSPFVQYFEDTYNTLTYAHRAKSIKNNAVRNVLNAQSHLTNYVNIINNLKRQNQQLRAQMIKNGDPASPKRKGNTLPLIQSSSYNAQIQRMQQIIEAHFKNQANILSKIHDYTQKIEKAAFQIFKIDISKDQKVQKNQKKKKFSPQKTKSQQHVHQIIIQECTTINQDLSKQFEDLNNSRQNLIKQIKNNDITGKMGQPYLLALFKQKKIQIQKMNADFQYKLYELQKKQKKIVVDFMKQQIKVRQKIIEDQKVLIQKNNIINRITYSKMKQLDELDMINSSSQIQRGNILLTLKPFKNQKQTQRKDKNKSKNKKKFDLQYDPGTFDKKKHKINSISLNKLPKKALRQFDKIQPSQIIKQKDTYGNKLKHHPSEKIGIDKNLIYQPRKPYYHAKKSIADISMQSEKDKSPLKKSNMYDKNMIQPKISYFKIMNRKSKSREQKNSLTGQDQFDLIKEIETKNDKKNKLQRSKSKRKMLDVVMINR